MDYLSLIGIITCIYYGRKVYNHVALYIHRKKTEAYLGKNYWKKDKS